MSKKQTAVEWLVEQILKEKKLLDLDIQQAKEMEKQQIIEAYDSCCDDIYYSDSEEYYTETYGKKNN